MVIFLSSPHPNTSLKENLDMVSIFTYVLFIVYNCYRLIDKLMRHVLCVHDISNQFDNVCVDKINSTCVLFLGVNLKSGMGSYIQSNW